MRIIMMEINERSVGTCRRIFDVVFSSLRHPEKSAARGVPSDSCDVAGLRAQSQHNHVQYTAVYFLMENVYIFYIFNQLPEFTTLWSIPG